MPPTYMEPFCRCRYTSVEEVLNEELCLVTPSFSGDSCFAFQPMDGSDRYFDAHVGQPVIQHNLHSSTTPQEVFTIHDTCFGLEFHLWCLPFPPSQLWSPRATCTLVHGSVRGSVKRRFKDASLVIQSVKDQMECVFSHVMLYSSNVPDMSQQHAVEGQLTPAVSPTLKCCFMR